MKVSPLPTYCFAVFDTETTGLSTSKDEIIQIGCSIINEKGEKQHADYEMFATLVYSERPISPSATKIHNIKNEDLKDQPLFKVVIGQMIEFVKKYNKTNQQVVLVAYNGHAFDFKILGRQLDENKINYTDLFNFVLDPLEIIKYTNCFPERPAKSSNTLGNIYKYVTEKSLEKAHDAKNDVLALVKICQDPRVLKYLALYVSSFDK